MLFRILFALFLSISTVAGAQTQRIDHVEVELISDHSQAVAGQTIRAGVRYSMDPQWHIYWTNPGDSGIPTSIQWLNAELANTKVNTPAPHRIDMPPMTNYGWEDDVILWSDIQIPENASGEYFLQAQTTFLMCKDICLPGSANFNLNIPVKDTATLSQHADDFTNAVQHTATEIVINVTVTYETGAKRYLLDFPQSNWSANTIFIPNNEGLIEDFEKQNFQVLDGLNRLVIAGDRFVDNAPETFNGLLVDHSTGQSAHVEIPVTIVNTPVVEAPPAPQEITQTETAAEIENMTFVTAMLLAFLGGLILNLMPCVLPVISLKVMGLVHHAQSKWAWFYGLVYTAGILTTFYIFAQLLIFLKAQGMEMGWGFQLQEPMFVAALTMILFLVALELFNVFEIGTTFGRLQNIIGRKNNVLTTFLSGMLITVVATPCTVPFMGGAVAYSLVQEADITIQIFLMLGFGLAFPYLLLTFIPRLRKYLPKPGPWEEKFQEFLGFPMLATALWLTWVYAKQTTLDELFMLLAGLFTLALGAWVYGHMGSLNSTWKRKLLAFLVFYTSLALCIASFGGHKVIARDLLGITYFEDVAKYEELYQPWSKEAVAEAKSLGRPVFINFTADWCITCKANEFAVLKKEDTIRFFEESGVLVLKADWTKQDEIIGAELARYGRRGVPLYVSINEKGEETVLPQILTPNSIYEAY